MTTRYVRGGKKYKEMWQVRGNLIWIFNVMQLMLKFDNYTLNHQKPLYICAMCVCCMRVCRRAKKDAVSKREKN